MQEPRSHSEVQVEPLVESVLVNLRSLVLTGVLAPGTRLRTERLAEELGVSRTPLRTAMAILAIEGLLDYSINRGYSVREQTLPLVLAALDTRAPLQAAAVRAVAGRADRESVLRYLRTVHRTMGDLVAAATWSEHAEREWHEAHFAFYRRLVYGAENLYLRAAIRMTVVYPTSGDLLRIYEPIARLARPEFGVLPAHPPQYAVETQFDHDRLLSRITQGDVERAGHLAFEIVTRERERLLAAVTANAA